MEEERVVDVGAVLVEEVGRLARVAARVWAASTAGLGAEGAQQLASGGRPPAAFLQEVATILSFYEGLPSPGLRGADRDWLIGELDEAIQSLAECIGQAIDGEYAVTEEALA